MSKPVKILLAAATLWPLLYLFGFIAFVFFSIFADFQRGPGASHEPPGGFPGFMVLFALHAMTMLWIMALMAVYLIHLFKTDRVPNDKKALWAICIFMGSFFAMPVYWYLNIWRDEPLTETPAVPSSG